MEALAPTSAAFGVSKIRRKDLPPGHSLCEYCTAKCCRYFALPIDAPETFTSLRRAFGAALRQPQCKFGAEPLRHGLGSALAGVVLRRDFTEGRCRNVVIDGGEHRTSHHLAAVRRRKDVIRNKPEFGAGR